MIDSLDLDGINVIDYFAAGGGWDEAMRMLGRTDVLGVEFVKAACDTAIAAGHKRLLADVRDMRPHLREGMVEGFIASPPCQTFSMAGKGAGREAMEALLAALMDVAIYGIAPENALALQGNSKLDERSALVLEPMLFIGEVMPRWIALEQVPAVLPIWQKYAEIMQKMGYHVAVGNVQAEQYGVPQTRKRAILVASLDGPVALPTPTHSRYHARTPSRIDDGVEKWVSMAEALGWGMTQRPYPTIACARTSGGPDKEKVGGSTARAIIYRERDEGRWADGPVAAVEGDTSWVYDRPSPTIVGSFAPDVVAKPGYRKAGDPPRQKTPGSVRISLEEAAVLQSFPRGYPWQGSQTARFRQVGDAIPPLLARAVLEPLIASASVTAADAA